MSSVPLTATYSPLATRHSSLVIRDRRAIVAWLSLCLALVACMVLVGGYTRLSGSGLSITQWKPIHGTVPPLDEAQWQEEFDAYRQSPQYEKINRGMTPEEFKTIYWPEYLHRLLGRLIGIVFLAPLLFFALRRSVSRRFGIRLAAIFALGGLQGVIGWLMVASGLIDNPHVSHLRLTLHLSLAFLIFALIEWALLDIAAGKQRLATSTKSVLTASRQPLLTYFLWFSLLCLQIILGAMLAGLHGGLVYNSWPDMNGQLLPDEWLEGGILENIPLIQFLHRTLAAALALGFLLWWYSHREYVKNAHLGKVCAGAAVIIAAQFTLGVATLLNAAPLSLALAHQMTALALFATGVLLLHKLADTEDA